MAAGSARALPVGEPSFRPTSPTRLAAAPRRPGGPAGCAGLRVRSESRRMSRCCDHTTAASTNRPRTRAASATIRFVMSVDQREWCGKRGRKRVAVGVAAYVLLRPPRNTRTRTPCHPSPTRGGGGAAAGGGHGRPIAFTKRLGRHPEPPTASRTTLGTSPLGMRTWGYLLEDYGCA